MGFKEGGEGGADHSEPDDERHGELESSLEKDVGVDEEQEDEGRGEGVEEGRGAVDQGCDERKKGHHERALA